MAIAELKGVQHALTQADYLWEVRLVRALVGSSFAVGFLYLAYEVWRRRCASWWRTLRIVLTACCTIRLAATMLLRALDAGEDNYPPGRLTYRVSLEYNVACILYATVGLSVRGRRLLAEWTGFSRVVLTLKEVPELPAAGSEAWGAGCSYVFSRSSRSDKLSGSSRRRCRVRFQLADACSVRSAESGKSGSSRSSRSGRSGCSGISGISGHGGRDFRRDWAAPLPPPHSAIRKRSHWALVRGQRLTMYPEDFAKMNENLSSERVRVRYAGPRLTMLGNDFDELLRHER